MKRNSAYRYVIMLSIVLGLLLSVPQQGAAKDAKVGIAARFEEASIRPGEQTTLTVTFAVPSGFHLYSMTKIQGGPLPLNLTIADPVAPLSPSTVWHGTTPAVKLDPNFEKAVELYDDEVQYSRGFNVSKDASGEIRVPIKTRGQICNEDRCIPFRETITATLRLEDGPPRDDRRAPPLLKGDPFPEDRPAPTMKDVKTRAAEMATAPPLGKGLFGFILIAFLAGLGALVTPCVFPMIPITVSFFSKFSKVSIRRSVTMASIYAASIVTTFTLMGVLISAIFGAVGMQVLSASAGFNIFLTLLLAVFAFNLFGLFEIQMPGWLVARTSAKERSLAADEGSLLKQAGGVFFMAVTFTLVSFTCTVGFIGVVLAEAAKGNWFYPAIGMLAFSLAFSLPFFFLALFPSVADKLRGKGGDWMVAVKVVLGFLELASAFKFLSNVDLLWQWGAVTRPLVLTVWTALFAGAALYLLRVFNLPHSDPDTRHVGPIRMVFALLLLSLAIYSASGIRDTKSMGGWLDGWLPPAVYPGSDTSDDRAHLDWIVDDIEKGMRVAKSEKRPLFVDFTGYTCTNCRYMEGSIFPKPQVRSRLEKMVRVSAYTDCEKPICETQRAYQLERFDTAALPFYAIIDPYTDNVLAVHPDMSKNVDQYVAFLDQSLTAFANAVSARKEKTVEKATPPDLPPHASLPLVKKGHPDTDSRNDADITISTSGEPVDFSFPSLFDGKTLRLSAFRGQWVFLNFWASWCAPCKKELKEEFPPALKSAPHVKLVTVDFDGDDTKEAAVAFAKESGLENHVVLQGGADITEAGLSDAFKVSENLPISYLIHPKGHIAWYHAGSVDRALLLQLFAMISKSSKQ